MEVVAFCLNGCCMLSVFAAGIHLSRAWMSGSFGSVQWIACVHRLDLGLYWKSFGGMQSETMLTPKGKITSTAGSEEVWTCDNALSSAGKILRCYWYLQPEMIGRVWKLCNIENYGHIIWTWTSVQRQHSPVPAVGRWNRLINKCI